MVGSGAARTNASAPRPQNARAGAIQTPAGKESKIVPLTFRSECHTWYGMKMTMHIDEELLDRVVKRFGCESKTEAVEMALKEMDRKARFRDMVKTGLGFTPDELRNAVDPDYDVPAMRAAEEPAAYRTRKPARSRK